MSTLNQLFTSKEKPYMNNFFPWREGIFTTSASWVEVRRHGQVAQVSKLKPGSNTRSEPSRTAPIHDIVIALQLPNGLVQWVNYDFAAMTEEQIRQLPIQYKLDDFQQKAVDIRLGAIVAPTVVSPYATKPPVLVDSVVITQSKYQLAAEKLAGFFKADKVFGQAQMAELWEIAINAPDELPGTIKPFQLPLAPPEMLTRLAAERKIHWRDFQAEQLAAKTDDAERAALEQTFATLRAGNEKQDAYVAEQNAEFALKYPAESV